MSHLVEHAKEELVRAGFFDKTADYDGMLGIAVVELVEKFASQGHSGFSAGVTLDIFNRLARFQTLTPLTNSPAEWVLVAENQKPEGVEKIWQNRRSPSWFSLDGGKTGYSVDDKERKVVTFAEGRK